MTLEIDADAIDCAEQAEVIWALREKGVTGPRENVALLSHCP